MAEKSVKGVNPNLFENDFGERPGTDLEMNDTDFEYMALEKVKPSTLRSKKDREAYEAYLKKHKISL